MKTKLNKITYKTLKSKIELAYQSLKKCNLCPRICNVDRTKKQKGFCGVLDKPVISSYGPHFGEETPLVGRYGSGTIFFSRCNLGCVFCQNYDISHFDNGKNISVERLSEIILELQGRGCHNINFVSPTHQLPFIIDSLLISLKKGLNIPVVWNCGGYESEASLELLDGIVDIYMPDFKFWKDKTGEKFSGIKEYSKHVKKAILKMHEQTGDLFIENNIAVSGLLVRHLVMPGYVTETFKIIEWLKNKVSENTYLNLMDQYRPCFQAYKYPEINCKLNFEEYRKVRDFAQTLGLNLL